MKCIGRQLLINYVWHSKVSIQLCSQSGLTENSGWFRCDKVAYETHLLPILLGTTAGWTWVRSTTKHIFTANCQSSFRLIRREHLPKQQRLTYKVISLHSGKKGSNFANWVIINCNIEIFLDFSDSARKSLWQNVLSSEQAITIFVSSNRKRFF